MKAMILAAGYGKRMRPLTETTPKPLLLAGGKPLIEYHIESLAAAGITDLVINTAWLGQQIQDYVGDGSRYGVQVQWSPEAEPLETGGGIYAALSFLLDDQQGEQPFLVVNGDIWTDFPFRQLAERGLADDEQAHLVLVPNPPQHPQGDFVMDSRQRITYPQSLGQSTSTFSGISLQRPQNFSNHKPQQAAFPLWDVLRPAMTVGAVSGQQYNGRWFDIGTVERLQVLDSQLSKKQFNRDA
ncbi:nucleotidyltransferase family protein [Porticoccus sp. W117]|uniref:N-acetylmuramate alpha-1-phosphate uridylyltransferase MurU n=1 Tax=Porticoccus sp. W117 TaxID=3054777 RepID=UPI0025981F6F|nr:nucleotidyltransferase family protein [Porticoccus sp. W117]MDM3870675.1 nucleotidyltransferase family protein [Porticoccus sp. W117]